MSEGRNEGTKEGTKERRKEGRSDFILFRSQRDLVHSSFPGDTLFLNIPSSKSRPKTADSVPSSVKSQEHYTMFPYKNSTESASDKRKSRDSKMVSAVKVRTHAQDSASSDEDGED